jgi:hypothetical protein
MFLENGPSPGANEEVSICGLNWVKQISYPLLLAVLEQEQMQYIDIIANMTLLIMFMSFPFG